MIRHSSKAEAEAAAAVAEGAEAEGAEAAASSGGGCPEAETVKEFGMQCPDEDSAAFDGVRRAVACDRCVVFQNDLFVMVRPFSKCITETSLFSEEWLRILERGE